MCVGLSGENGGSVLSSSLKKKNTLSEYQVTPRWYSDLELELELGFKLKKKEFKLKSSASAPVL